MEKEATRSQIHLPPGFRFYPTDEELVVHYLCKRAASQPFAVPVIAEIELYKFDPWDLPGKALFGEKEWYFFSPRDRKYPNGSRPNRAAGSGYWKATGTDKPVTSGGCRKVGVKKSLVFYKGRAPKGVKTNWIMHEYCLADSAIRAQKTKGSVRLDDWVLCRVYEKIYGVQKDAMAKECNVRTSCKEDVLASLPETDEINPQVTVPRINSLNRISSLKSAMQYNHKFIQNAMQINHAAYNVSDRQFSNDSVSTNSVMRPASTKNNEKEKKRHSNGSIDSNTAIMVTEAGSYGIDTIENQNLYLGSGVPTLMQMGSRVERPWMSTDTMAEEVVQISDSQSRRLPSIQRPFRSNGNPLIQSSFSQLESLLSLGDDDAFFATL